MDNIILLQTRKRLTQTNERYIKCYYKDNNRREDARTTPCALSFCAYTEREKETTTTPKEPQSQENKTKKESRQGRKPSRRAGESRTREENERTKGKILQEIATSHITA